MAAKGAHGGHNDQQHNPPTTEVKKIDLKTVQILAISPRTTILEFTLTRGSGTGVSPNLKGRLVSVVKSHLAHVINSRSPRCVSACADTFSAPPLPASEHLAQ